MDLPGVGGAEEGSSTVLNKSLVTRLTASLPSLLAPKSPNVVGTSVTATVHPTNASTMPAVILGCAIVNNNGRLDVCYSRRGRVARMMLFLLLSCGLSLRDGISEE